jgi:FkbM family methyltransferase
VPENTFVSYAQNREDVVLWRALRDIGAGRYVEVGANHPRHDSVTRAFYDRGWSGVTVEPVPAFVDLHRAERPRDTQVEAAVTSRPAETVTLHVVGGTGLSTLVDSIGADHASVGLDVSEVEVRAATLDAVLDESLAEDDPIHFMVVDVEGAEREVLESVDLRRRRPWVLVVEATAPSNGRSDDRAIRPTHDEWEAIVTGAGYVFCQFDGLSRFYVAEEHAELAEALSVPAGPLDFFTTDELVGLRTRISALEETHDELERQTVHWRAVAIAQWSEALATVTAAAQPPVVVDDGGPARAELAAMRRTVSWRVTRPLRLARRVAGRVKRALR